MADADSDIERTNIALRLWTGCLCVTKECMLSSVTEYSPDGTIKREIPYTPEMRAESFKKIMRTVDEDPVYRAGVEVAPVWELIVNAEPNKKMYLDGIPNLTYSPSTKHVKDRNKIIISADDIEKKDYFKSRVRGKIKYLLYGGQSEGYVHTEITSRFLVYELILYMIYFFINNKSLALLNVLGQKI